jgi:hypothetical protein
MCEQMDIEGAEFKFLESVVETEGHLLGGTNQILLEFHVWTKEGQSRLSSPSLPRSGSGVGL